MRLPTWLKILLILVLFSLVFTILAAVSRYLVPIIFYIALMLFPGPDRENPRLVRWSPALYGLSFAAAVAFLIAGFMGKTLVDPSADMPTAAELWQTIIFVPPLIWALVTRHVSFRYILIISTVISIGLGIYDCATGAQNAKSYFEFFGDSTGELIWAIYLLVKFKPMPPASALAKKST